MNIGVLASGGGSNLQAIIDACESGYILGQVVVVVSDKESAYALQRAKQHNITAVFEDPKNYQSRTEYDEKLLKHLEDNDVDVVVHAGYMRLVGEPLLSAYKNKSLNIHPSLLPAFPGTRGIKDAYNYGVKVTGVTVHFIDKGMDTGPIILQEAVRIEDSDTLETLEEKIHEVEHRIFPKAVKLFIEGRLGLEGRKVTIRRQFDKG